MATTSVLFHLHPWFPLPTSSQISTRTVHSTSSQVVYSRMFRTCFLLILMNHFSLPNVRICLRPIDL